MKLIPHNKPTFGKSELTNVSKVIQSGNWSDGKITEKSVQAISVKPILIFVQKTRYKPLYDFDRVARQTFDRVWPVEAAAAIQREIEKL